MTFIQLKNHELMTFLNKCKLLLVQPHAIYYNLIQGSYFFYFLNCYPNRYLLIFISFFRTTQNDGDDGNPNVAEHWTSMTFSHRFSNIETRLLAVSGDSVLIPPPAASNNVERPPPAAGKTTFCFTNFFSPSIYNNIQFHEKNFSTTTDQ